MFERNRALKDLKEQLKSTYAIGLMEINDKGYFNRILSFGEWMDIYIRIYHSAMLAHKSNEDDYKVLAEFLIKSTVRVYHTEEKPIVEAIRRSLAIDYQLSSLSSGKDIEKALEMRKSIESETGSRIEVYRLSRG